MILAEAQDIQNQTRTLYLLNRANSTLQNHTHHFLIFHPRSAIEKSTWREALLKDWLDDWLDGWAGARWLARPGWLWLTAQLAVA